MRAAAYCRDQTYDEIETSGKTRIPLTKVCCFHAEARATVLNPSAQVHAPAKRSRPGTGASSKESSALNILGMLADRNENTRVVAGGDFEPKWRRIAKFAPRILNNNPVFHTYMLFSCWCRENRLETQCANAHSGATEPFRLLCQLERELGSRHPCPETLLYAVARRVAAKVRARCRG